MADTVTPTIKVTHIEAPSKAGAPTPYYEPPPTCAAPCAPDYIDLHGMTFVAGLCVGAALVLLFSGPTVPCAAPATTLE